MDKDEKKLELAARAAWMYYVTGQTQQDIAQVLGVSRQVAQRLVSLAREQGMVKVHITHPVDRCLKLAEQMQEKFSLALCRVVPSMGLDDEKVEQMIALDSAEVISLFVSDEKPLTVAVGSGRMLRAAINELPYLERPQHSCVSLIGAIARDGSCTRYDVPLWMAEKTQGKYFILPAPLFADSAEDRYQWCNHRIYHAVAEKAQRADVTFIGIGQIERGCPLNVDGFITDKQVDRLKEQRTVAEMLGHFIGEDGQRVSSELDETLTSIALKPRTDRKIIAFAGGRHKYSAVRAVLIGQWISGLVTDEETACRLLADDSLLPVASQS